jgi:cupin 2 domain-containing protein
MQKLNPYNIFQNIPDIQEDEIFETILQNKNLKLERIISSGQITPHGKWYDQDFDEWVILLSGKAVLSFESPKDKITLLPGDYIFIESHKKHRIEYTDIKQKTLWLALHIIK